MSSLTEKLGIVVSAEDLASGKLGKVNSELKGMESAAKGGASGLLAHGGAMSKVEATAGRLGGTLSNLRGKVGGLASSFGALAGVGGILSIAGLLKGSIDEAAGMGLEMEKLTALTGIDVEKTSALAAVFGKFGIQSAQVEKIVGFEEKTLGKLSETQGKAAKSTALLALENQKLTIQLAGGKTKAIDAQIAHQKALDAVNNLASGTNKLVQFEQQHGIVLTDTQGKLLDFGTVLGRVADYYNSNRSAGEKAVVAAQVFGKSYQNMIPILRLGSKGIAEAETAAKALGLTLTTGNAKDLRDYTANMRELGDAGHGLQLQIGLAVVPALGELAKAATGFLAGGGKDAIVGFFRSGVGFARDMGSAITTFIVPAFGAIAGAWNGVPGPLKQLLLTGLIANKVLKMTIGFDPLDMARKAIADAVGGFFSKGGSPVNPLFVKDVTGGLGGAGGTAAAGGGMLAKALPIAAIVGSVAAVIATQQEVSGRSSAIATTDQAKLAAYLKTAPTAAQLQTSLAGVQQGIDDIRSNPLNVLVQGDALNKLEAMKLSLQAQLATSSAPGRLNSGDSQELYSKLGKSIASPIVLKLDLLHADFQTQTHALAASKDPKAIAAAVLAVARDVQKGVGNVASTKGLLGDLQGKLTLTTDPAERRALQTAIAMIGAKLPGREWIAAQEASANKIIASGIPQTDKLRELTAIQRDFTARGDTVAAGIISTSVLALTPHIDALKGALAIGVAAGVAAGARPFIGPVAPKPPALPYTRHAAGLLGLTGGATDLGVAGEAGGEAVAIVRNPRGMGPLSSARQTLQAHLALTIPITVAVQHSAREAFKATTQWTRYGGAKTVGID